MPTPIQSRINSVTGASRRVARQRGPMGNQARAMRSARVLTGNNPTPAMRRAEGNYSRRKSNGGAGG